MSSKKIPGPGPRPLPSPMPEIGDYARHIERLIVQAQGGALMRITGADFATVQGWHADGIDLARIAAEIDRTVARQQARGSVRRIAVRYLDSDLRRPSRAERRIDRLRDAVQAGADAIRQDLRDRRHD